MFEPLDSETVFEIETIKEVTDENNSSTCRVFVFFIVINDDG